MDNLQQTASDINGSKAGCSTTSKQAFEFMGLMQPDGILIEINQTALDFAGVTNQEVIGFHFWELNWLTISKEDQTRLHRVMSKDKLLRIYAQAAMGKLVRLRADVLGADQTIVTVDFVIRPVKSESGEIILLILKGEAVTESKQPSTQQADHLASLQQAKNSNDLYPEIVNNLPLGLNVWHLEDPNNINSLRLVTTNATFSYLTGVSLSDYLGRNIADCYPREFAQPSHWELYAKVALGELKEGQQEIEYSGHNPPSYFSVKAFSLPDRCVGVVWENITQQKQAALALEDISAPNSSEQTLEQRALELRRSNQILSQTTRILQKRNEELDQFVYVASHDLKAPLRAIASLSQWLEEDLGDQLPAENQHQMRLLRGRVHRMGALINGLLEYTGVGRTEKKYSVVNVDALLKEVIDSLQPPPNFIIEVSPVMPTLRTKQLLLQQVFANLISNAIKHHTETHGHVKISVQDQGRYYEFAVADDGPGIPPEYYEKIFVIFQTLDAHDSRENTGIGLAIVKKIVETEGGTITLTSSLGIGSTFHFTWPKHKDE